MGKFLFFIFCFLIISCKTTNKNYEPYLGFWALSSSAYLELKKNGDFEFMWSKYIGNTPLTGTYLIDTKKQNLILYIKNNIQVWQIELSSRGWIIFLKDLQSYKYTFYKTDKKRYFLQNFEPAK